MSSMPEKHSGSIHLEKIQSEANKHRLIGGALCLNFANTLNGHRRLSGHEYLKEYCDLVVWCWKAGILTKPEVEPLIHKAIQRSGEAVEAYQQAIALREAIFRIFAAIAGGASIEAADLAQLNAARSRALARSQIAQSTGGFALDWSDKSASDWLLWPITLSAADLLTSGITGQIRQCAGEGCDWLFLDTSRNHMRRWCSMDECGNRAKSQRFLERRRRPAIHRE